MKWISAFFLVLILTIALSGSGVTSAAYNTIENAGSAVTQRPIMNFTSGCTPADNSGANRTDIACTGGFPVQVNGTPLSGLTTLNLAAGSGMTLTPTGSGAYTVTFVSSGGGGGVVYHHEYYTAATTDGSGGARSTLNGNSTTFLGANTLGILQMASTNTSNLTIFIPSTWDGSAINIVADATTSSNATGNYSFTPAFACINNGTDIGAAFSYSSGSTVTQAAPGGSGTGFYRESVAMAVTPTGCAGQSVNLRFTRGGADTYAATMYFLGVDVAIKY